MLSEAPLDIIRTRHYNAEWALVTQVDALSAQFDEIEDEYLRERKADIQQVAERVLKVLTGTAHQLPRAIGVDEQNANMIVVAKDISPADMMQFKRSVFHGFITDIGGKTSHTAIVARSMDIPAVVGTREASRLIRQDDWVIIDGDSGVMIVDSGDGTMTPKVLAAIRKLTQRPIAYVVNTSAEAEHIGGNAVTNFGGECVAVDADGGHGMGPASGCEISVPPP